MTITVTGYLDLPIEQAREQQEAHGRERARETGRPWPMPPDHYGPGRQPRDRAAHYQRFEAGIIEDEERARALLVVTEAMEARAGEVVQVDEKPVRIADTSAKKTTIPREWTDPVKDEPTREPESAPVTRSAERVPRQ